MVSKALHFFLRAVDWVSSQLGDRQRTHPLPYSYYDLIEMFEKPGCAVCNLLLHDADRTLDTILYELALDPDIHQAFRARRGLCDEHSWQLLKHKGRSLGIALLYRAALDEALRIIEATPTEEATIETGFWGLGRKPGESSLLARRLEPVRPCAICESVSGAEQRYVHTLSQYVVDTRLADAYQASDGLCLPHFRQALRTTRDPSRRRRLADIQRAALSRLKADLDGFIDKSNYLRRHEITPSEGHSWRRVIRIAGERGVFGPDSREDS